MDSVVEQHQGRPGLRQGELRLWGSLDDVFEEMCHLGQPELGRMAFVVEANESARPGNERFRGRFRVATPARR
jgi:hypothetical protein